MFRLQTADGKRTAFEPASLRTTFYAHLLLLRALYKRIVCPASIPAWRSNGHDQDPGFIAEFTIKHQLATRVSTVISIL